MCNSVQQNFRQNGGCRLVDNQKRNDQLRGRTAGQTWTDSTQSTDHLTAVRFGRHLEGRGRLHGKEESIGSQRALSVIRAAHAQQRARGLSETVTVPTGVLSCLQYLKKGRGLVLRKKSGMENIFQGWSCVAERNFGFSMYY